MRLRFVMVAALFLCGATDRVIGQQADASRAQDAVARGCRLYESGDRDAAGEVFRGVLDAEPPHGPSVLQIAAYLAVSRLDYVAAEPYARKAAELEDTTLESRAPLFHVLLALRKIEEYEAIARGLVERWPEQPFALFNVGMACTQAHKHLEAQRWIEAALERDKQNPLFFFSAGENCVKLRRYETAERFFRRCLKLDAKFDGAEWSLGQVLGYLGRKREAEALLRKAAEGGGRDAGFAYGVFLVQEERYEEALPLFRGIVASRPRDRVVWNYLSICNQRLRRMEAAKAAARRYRELQSEQDQREEEALLRRLRTAREREGAKNRARNEGSEGSGPDEGSGRSQPWNGRPVGQEEER